MTDDGPGPRPILPRDTVFRVSGSAMQLLVQSDLYLDPHTFDGGTDSAHEARAALRRARRKASGAFETWTVHTSRPGALVIAEQCERLREGRKAARSGRPKREAHALWRVVKAIDAALRESPPPTA